MSRETPLGYKSLTDIYSEAELAYPGTLWLNDILTCEDHEAINARLDGYITQFNQKYALDGWDYAIASGCGLFAAMLDIFFVSAPAKPTTPWEQKVDGIFNQSVQKAFNKFIPPELSKKLGALNKIGSADLSVVKPEDLAVGVLKKAVSPTNHRLRSLSHDPVLGFIFGLTDMIKGTCTVVHEGRIVSMSTARAPVDGTIFQLLGRMFGHLLSDVNAPSGGGNRGMGLPAPFMGLLKMLKNIPPGDSDFGRQIEYIYVNGYDFRQFVATSMPMMIMEVMMRAFWIIKQMSLYTISFSEALLDTVPMKLNPRFRMMLALGYGTSSAVNAGKVYITNNLLNLNYASWMGLCWNGFHALKWTLLQRHLKLWSGIEEKEILHLEQILTDIEGIESRAASLPV